MSVIVIDPGHGGEQRIGSSSPNTVTGRDGTREKDLTLDVARRVRDRLAASGHTAVLTRERDVNLSLAARVGVAQARRADAFVSLHFNGAATPEVQGSETWIHRDAGRGSELLARSVHRRLVGATGLADGGVQRADLGVLSPGHHARATAAALLEISYLSDPREERRLQDAGYRTRVAGQIADGVIEYVRRLGGPNECRDIRGSYPAVPDSIAIAPSARMVAALHGMGVQVYKVGPKPSMSGVYVWLFQGPDARLYDDDGNEVGTHHGLDPKTPVWKVGESVVSARKREPVHETPNRAVDVPWLLLDTLQRTEGGTFEGVRWIQRLNTAGGQPPAGALTRADEGRVARVECRADYYFFA
jgi:N-acetylmuramoyl-L-alanine amidase